MKARDDSPTAILTAAGISWTKTSRNEVRFPCPYCGRKEGFDLNLKTGFFRCKRASCGEVGGTYRLKVALGLAYEVAPATPVETGPSPDEVAAFVKIESEVDRMHRFLVKSPAAQKAREYLESRAFTPSLWTFARLGFYPRVPDGNGIPRMDRNGLVGIPYLVPDELTRARAVKLRWIPPEPQREGKTWRYTRVSGGESCLFAPYGVDTAKTALLVGGELDALSVCQALITAGVSSHELSWFPVSIPDGESSWTTTLTEELAEVEDVVVCFDEDAAGRKGAEHVAEAIGRWRCRRARWPDGEKDGNEALQHGALDLESLDRLIAAATSYAGESVVSGESVLEDVIEFIFDERTDKGWPTGIDGLDDVIGGWRPGEVTIVSGGSGAGKTTFCAQMTAERLRAGHRCFIVALEGGYRRFMTKLGRHCLGHRPKDGTRHEFRTEMRNLMKGRLFVSKVAERFDPSAFVETLRYCIVQLDVMFVVLDHLSFAIDRDKSRWMKQNALILGVQLTIQSSSAHMLMVAHPKKVSGVHGANRDDVIVQMTDLKGESEVYQDIANVIALYRPRKANRKPYIDTATGHCKAAIIVDKCRDEDGDEGGVELLFDKDGGRYYDAPQTSTTIQPGNFTVEGEF